MSRREREKDRVLAVWREYPDTYLNGPDAQDTRNAFAVGSMLGRLKQLRDAHGSCGPGACRTCTLLDGAEGLFDALEEAAP